MFESSEGCCCINSFRFPASHQLTVSSSRIAQLSVAIFHRNSLADFQVTTAIPFVAFLFIFRPARAPSNVFRIAWPFLPFFLRFLSL